MVNRIMHRAAGRRSLDLNQVHGGGREFDGIVVLMEINNDSLAGIYHYL